MLLFGLDSDANRFQDERIPLELFVVLLYKGAVELRMSHGEPWVE
jgi:hypothetical protein